MARFDNPSRTSLLSLHQILPPGVSPPTLNAAAGEGGAQASWKNTNIIFGCSTPSTLSASTNTRLGTRKVVSFMRQREGLWPQFGPAHVTKLYSQVP